MIFLLLSLVLNNLKQIMEEDILNYLPTVMFCGTPCNSGNKWKLSSQVQVKP